MRTNTTTTPQQNRARRLLDRQIDQTVRERCSGLAIDIMDIGKVFQAGYEAARVGVDVADAVEARYRQLAK